MLTGAVCGVCVYVYVCFVVGGGGISASLLFPRHGEEGGAIIPLIPAQRGQGMVG